MISPLERIVALAHDLGLTSVKEYSRLEKGKLEHVGQYERGGAHPDDEMALREHLELATLAYQRGDARSALEHLEDAKAHMAAPPGHGNARTHGVNHLKGKHAKQQDAMLKGVSGAMKKDKHFGMPARPKPKEYAHVNEKEATRGLLEGIGKAMKSKNFGMRT